jgi:hypothetical protein
MSSELPIALSHDIFESAPECFAFLAKAETGSLLFRGESRPYPKTCPGTRRVLEDDSLHIQEQTYWIDLAGNFEHWFCQHTGQGTLDSAQMFLQHYGIPTDLLDFSADPEIAIFFASLSHPDDLGLVCSMNIQKAEEVADVFSLADFMLVPGLPLQRPKKQKGFAVRHRPGLPSDLKSQEARKALGLDWYAFRKVEHEEYIEKHKDILQVDDDKVALYVMATQQTSG